MPRGPSGSYTYPDGTRGISGQTIYSARYNTFLDDLATTLNTALPINMGGTGGTTVIQARDNLGVEVSASQQVVMNYDSHIWQSGSFSSNAGATGAPEATAAYLGTAQVFDPPASNYIVVEARNITTGKLYVRRKQVSWGAWEVTGTDADYVNVTGDTMTGDLMISKVTPFITLDKVGASEQSAIRGGRGGLPRWILAIGDQSNESGSNNGSDFTLYRYNDAGSTIGIPLMINRASGMTDIKEGMQVAGTATFTGAIVGIAGTVQIYGQGGNVNQATLYLNSAGTSQLFSDGTSYLFAPAGGMVKAVGFQAIAAGATVAPYGAAISVAFIGGGTQWGMTFRPITDSTTPIAFTNAAGSLIGSINTTASATSYATSSDERLKEDLKSFDAGNIIDGTMVYDFAWKATGERAYGMIAQEAKEVFPQAVTHNANVDTWGIDYSKYVPLLLQEIKSLRERVAALEKRA